MQEPPSELLRPAALPAARILPPLMSPAAPSWKKEIRQKPEGREPRKSAVRILVDGPTIGTSLLSGQRYGITIDRKALGPRTADFVSHFSSESIEIQQEGDRCEIRAEEPGSHTLVMALRLEPEGVLFKVIEYVFDVVRGS